MERENRTYQISIRLTESEREQIEFVIDRHKTRITKANFLRNIILDEIEKQYNEINERR